MLTKEMIQKSSEVLAEEIKDRRGEQIPERVWWEIDSSYKPVYRSVANIMTEHRECIFGGVWPSVLETKEILVKAHEYFGHVFKDPRELEGFGATYDFIRGAWDDDWEDRTFELDELKIL